MVFSTAMLTVDTLSRRKPAISQQQQQHQQQQQQQHLFVL